MEVKQAKDRFLKIEDVLELVNMGRTSWYHLIKNESAPKPIISRHRWTVWSLSDIDHWMDCMKQGIDWKHHNDGVL